MLGPFTALASNIYSIDVAAQMAAGGVAAGDVTLQSGGTSSSGAAPDGMSNLHAGIPQVGHGIRFRESVGELAAANMLILNGKC